MLEEGICRCIRASISRPNVSVLRRIQRRFDVVPEAERCIADVDGTDMHPVADENGFYF